ncbi:MAG: alkyl sulfatase dimerization domain-containing protein [Halobacteriales archaeon]|nr:alkyl sulfatase dimerization domain-containing protein [Halobacteriales archaeon]
MSQNPTDPHEIEMFEGNVDVTEVADDTYQFQSFSCVTAFDTGDGLVLVDTGLPAFSPLIADELRGRTDAPVDTAVYTHGHVDHAYGLGAYLAEGQEPPEVVAHEAMPDRFERYERTRRHNEVINARQFGGTTDAAEDHELSENSRFGTPDHPPTTLYSDDLTLRVGDLTFEVHHGRGETDDHSWLYCPERDVLCSGDFVIGVAPNAGNPQKVQRYPWDWADALREMAGVGAGTLCPGHGEPIVDDPDEVKKLLLGAADYLDTIVDRTLDALNDGSPPHVDVVREVELPEPEEPWLTEVYDDGEFIVRNVIRYYGGWWTGRPSELKPAGRGEVAEEVTALAGDAETLADRATETAESGDTRLACHLADYALEAAPDDEYVQEAVAGVYEKRADEEDDLMSKNIFTSAAGYAREGRTFR